MMKLCFNATTLRYMDIRDAVREIKKSGYDAVEIALNDTHLHPYQSSDEKIKEVKDLCESLGLVIAVVAAGGPTYLTSESYEPSMISRDQKGRRQRLDSYKAAIELGQKIGAPNVNINTGILRSNVIEEEAYIMLRTGLEELIAECSDDICLVLEQEPGFYVGTTDAAIKVIQDMHSPKLQFNLDIGHVFCCEPAAECYDNVERSMPYTRHIHIEDIKNRIHFHEIPGEGDIDWKRILKIIHDSGYEHYVCVELHNHDKVWHDALDKSYAFIRNLEKEMGYA